MLDDNFFDQQERMKREHDAWLDVVDELRSAGAGAINAGEENEGLHNAIVKWGEELAQLRINDPDTAHAENALREKRERYPGRFERETGA